MDCQRYLTPYLHNNPTWFEPFVCCSSGNVLNNVPNPNGSRICAILLQDNDDALEIVKFHESYTELDAFLTQIWWVSGRFY